MTDREQLAQILAQLDTMRAAVAAQLGSGQQSGGPAPQTKPMSPGGPTSMGGVPVGIGLDTDGSGGHGSAPAPSGGRFFQPPPSETAFLNGSYFRVGFAGPNDAAHSYSFGVPSMDTRRWSIVGDGGFQQGEIALTLDGNPVTYGQASSVIVGPGMHSIVLRCVGPQETRAAIGLQPA